MPSCRVLLARSEAVEATEKYTPFQVDYYENGKKVDSLEKEVPLDYFIYVPHGGKVKAFLEAHPDLVEVLKVNRGNLEAICNLEEDTFTPELADAMAGILATQNYRVAVMKVLVPREIIDVGRHKKLAIKPLTNFREHPEILEKHSTYYDQVQDKRKELLDQLDPEHGKFLDLHTMRSFEIEGLDFSLLKCLFGEEYENNESFDWKRFSLQQLFLKGKAWQRVNFFYEERIKRLRNHKGSKERKHCLVVHEKESLEDIGILKGDAIMVKILSKLFKKAGILFGISDPYFLSCRMSQEQIESYIGRGILVDLIKEALAKDPEAGLEDLEADPQKIQKYAVLLAKMLIVSQFSSEKV